MLKKGDVADDDDDNEVRTSASQNHATQDCGLRNSSSGFSIYSSLLISAERCGVMGGQKETVNGTQIEGHSWDSAPSWTSMLGNGVYETYVHNHFVTGEDK
jgi:hypothetical protein